ncbi:MAG TPA: prepilin-type N-terminal cleavage/methylation domain-containing protein [Verrucomicrobiae bacterium]
MFIDFKKRRRQLGVTLMEMMVAVGVGSVVLAAVASLSFYTARSMAAMSNYADLDRQSRNALDQMTLKIRSASRLTSFSATSVSFLYNGQTLTYSYSASTKRLTETLGSSSSVLLEDCNSLQFSMFQRNVMNGTFNQYTTTSITEAKSIIVTWTCARSLLGNLINSESVQSARIVIRNNP